MLWRHVEHPGLAVVHTDLYGKGLIDRLRRSNIRIFRYVASEWVEVTADVMK